MIIEAVNLKENELKTNNVSRLQLLIRKGETSKSCVLDSVITALINNNIFLDENVLVIAPTRKATLSMCGSTLHLREQGLSLPARKRFKDLDGKQLKFWKDKHKF